MENPSLKPNKFVTAEEIHKVISEYQSSFPLPYLLVVLGYAFILLIDRVIIDAHTAEADSHQTDHKNEAAGS